MSLRSLTPRHLTLLSVQEPAAMARESGIAVCGRQHSAIRVVLPRQRRVGIAPHFPVALLITVRERDVFDPLRTFPGIALRHDDPHRPALLYGERRAVPGVGEEHVLVSAGLQRQVGGVAVVGGEEDELRERQRPYHLHDPPEAHPFPLVIEGAPGRHTVKVLHRLELRLRQQVLPGLELAMRILTRIGERAKYRHLLGLLKSVRAASSKAKSYHPTTRAGALLLAGLGLGAGLLVLGPAHYLDYLRYLLSPPDYLSAWTANLSPSATLHRLLSGSGETRLVAEGLTLAVDGLLLVLFA